MRILKISLAFFSQMPHDYISGALITQQYNWNCAQIKDAEEIRQEEEYKKNLCLYLSFVDPFYETFIPCCIQD